MTTKTSKQTAKKIADHLFAQDADKLMLAWKGKTDGSAWGKAALSDAIAKILAEMPVQSKTYPKHYRPKEGEWVPHKDHMQWQCCDCGLVHDVKFALLNLAVRMHRNEPATRRNRRKKKL